ncbi:hypothetical protein Barb6_02787 [Bacteroidales bacterium Barb6]|nr:hypothetical protein Barb6_02787 [Bacteroidales bacterium Barb6]
MFPVGALSFYPNPIAAGIFAFGSAGCSFCRNSFVQGYFVVSA